MEIKRRQWYCSSENGWQISSPVVNKLSSFDSKSQNFLIGHLVGSNVLVTDQHSVHSLLNQV